MAASLYHSNGASSLRHQAWLHDMQGIEHGSEASHTSSSTLLDHSKQLQHLRGQDLFIQVRLPDFPHSSCKSIIASSAAQEAGTLLTLLCQEQCRQARLAGCAL